jgi:hypothetical protein
MQINGSDAELKALQNLALPAKVTELLESLASQPLKLEKMLLTQTNQLQLQLNKSLPLQQLQLPISSLKLLSLLKEVPVSIKLSLSNNQVVLEVTPQAKQPVNQTNNISQNTQTNIKTDTNITQNKASEKTPSMIQQQMRSNLKENNQIRLVEPVKIYFQKAHLTANKQLQLTQPVTSPVKPKANEKHLNAKMLAQTGNTQTSITNTQQTSNTKQLSKTQVSDQAQHLSSLQSKPTIKSYVQDFLKSRPVSSEPLAKNINQLIQASDKLLMSLKPILNNEKTKTEQQASVLQKPASADLSSQKNQQQNQKSINKQTIQSTPSQATSGKRTSLINQTTSISKQASQQVKSNESNPINKVLNQAKNIQNKNNIAFQNINALDQSTLLELVTKTPLQSKKLTIENKLQQLFNQINHLQRSLILQNQPLESRISSSGNFYESRLFQEASKSDQLVSSGRDNQAPIIKEAQPTQKKQSEATQKNRIENPSAFADLKKITQEIRQTLQELSRFLSQAQAQPLRSQKFIEQIIQAVKILNDLDKPTGQSRADSNSFNQNQTPQALTSKTSANQLEFNSPYLKRLVDTLSFVKPEAAQSLNQKQRVELINQQAALIRTMTNETQVLLSKIETNQMLSLNSQQTRNDAQMVQQFLIDLPIFHNQKVESFELLFESNENKKAKKPIKTWAVTIKFDLEPLGPMFAKVSLKDERISTNFFAENETTAKLLSQNIQHLKESLFTAGLDVEHVNGQQGVIPDELIKNDEYGVDFRV